MKKWHCLNIRVFHYSLHIGTMSIQKGSYYLITSRGNEHKAVFKTSKAVSNF